MLSLALGLLGLSIVLKIALTVVAVAVHISVELNFETLGLPGSTIEWVVFWAGVFLLPMLIGASLAAAYKMMRTT